MRILYLDTLIGTLLIPLFGSAVMKVHEATLQGGES